MLKFGRDVKGALEKGVELSVELASFLKRSINIKSTN